MSVNITNNTYYDIKICSIINFTIIFTKFIDRQIPGTYVYFNNVINVF